MNTLLGKKPEKEELNKQREKLSAVLREYDNEISLPKALAISTVAHPLLAFLSWLLIKVFILLLAFLGITLPLFIKPEPKIKDIEFIITNKPEQTPINKKTNLRSDRNSRAGGKHDPAKKISDPEPVTSSSKPQPQTPPPKKTTPKVEPKKQAEQKAVEEAPKAPPRPIPRQRPSNPMMKDPSAFSVPVPVTKIPEQRVPSVGGPVTSGPIGSSSQSSEPAPIMSSGSSGQNTLRSSRGYSTGEGNPGNPGPGDPNGRPGVDAIKEPDFGPYMRELQRKIKRKWNPPRGNKSKRVVLLFKVSKDGRLLTLKIQNPSGNPESDSAALDAVKSAAPFLPLPPEYRGDDIDIQFTFDYNVFGVGGHQY
ncbi:MAG TPA: TonB family protein [Candidatus Gastranaerophilales bacterium]|nr:TonB family protein [Candidatus Gastranaerophilales bacterium]